MKQRAGWLSSLSIRFQTYIKNSDPDTFSKMGRVYHDLIGVERRMNAIVESFRSDELNESHCLTELQRVISQVEHLAESHLNQVEKNNADIFFGLTKGLDLNADRMIVILTFMKQSLNNAVREEGLILEEGMGLMDQNYVEPLNRLIAQAKNSKIIAKKLMRRLEDMFEEAMTLKHDHLHRFKMLFSISTKLCRFCFETYKDIIGYIDTRRGSHEVLELSAIQKLLCEKGDELLEMVESSMWESALRTLKSLTNELETTHAQIERDDKLDKIASKVPPWIQRASDIKAEVVVNHELEHKLQQHNEEIIKLIKDVKMKDQALQESDVKISLLERRMDSAKKEVEQIKTLEDDLEKSINQEQMYAEAMENLQNEYDTLEAENIQLKKEASKREEKRQSLLRKANFDLTEGDNSTMQEMAGSYHEMSSQMEALKASVRYLRAENAQLKSSDFVRSLELDSSVLEVPSPTKTDHEKIRTYARETRVLMKDMRIASASPRVIKLSDHSREWQSQKKSPDFQYQTQQSVLYTLKQRSLQLKQRVDDLQIIPISPIKTQKSLQPLGLIRIPQYNQQSRGYHCIDINSVTDFKRIHNIFVQT
ncbi:dynein associated protein-domain-containing protein [Pilobolus umbonatus]|nr:dynein associated protein-domain-containing protein [Pilobolus umbonatus]